MTAIANHENLTDDQIVILDHMVEMVNEGVDLTSTGKPEAPALGERAGVDVSASLRDELMDCIESDEDPADSPEAPPEEPKVEAKAKKRSKKDILDELIELSRPPRRNQTHLRPADHQRLSDIHDGLLELKASK